MKLEILEKRYTSFNKGVEDALRKFKRDIGESVRSMRKEINSVRQTGVSVLKQRYSVTASVTAVSQDCYYN